MAAIGSARMAAARAATTGGVVRCGPQELSERQVAHGGRLLVEQPGERVAPQRLEPASHRIHRTIARRPGGGTILRSLIRAGNGRQGPFGVIRAGVDR